MRFRAYRDDEDLESVWRCWYECGWAEDSDEGRQQVRAFVGSGESYVADDAGTVRAAVMLHRGTMRYQSADVDMVLVAAVTTSRLSRKQGLATRLTSYAIADAQARQPATVAVLGIFDQGFYDKLGFGLGGQECYYAVQPRQLEVPYVRRSAVELGKRDLERIHRNRLRRRRAHGALNVDYSGATLEKIVATPKGFGLGFEREPGGELSHHLWLSCDDIEDGPYTVSWMAYETPEQLQELLGLVRNFDDHVRLVYIMEPAELALQSLIRRPFRTFGETRGGQHATRQMAMAYWQARVLDVDRAIEAMTLIPGRNQGFELELVDPIADHLDEQVRWRGMSGSYGLGFEGSSLVRHQGEAQGHWRTTVSQFSRWWLGTASLWELAMRDDVVWRGEAASMLEGRTLLPRPRCDWNL